jgi:hypothetical protein
VAAGRPREHNRDQIALDLLEWVQKDDSTNLCGFCADMMLDPCKISQWASEDSEFRKCVNIAKMHIARRRESMVNARLLYSKAYEMNAPVYDLFLKEEKQLQAQFESRLKQEEQTTVKEEDKTRFDAIMSQLSSLQSASNQATSNIKREDKS